MALENNFQDPDAYEKLQFYYHPDHLGSSSYITNLDGEVVQHIEYVPFGEVFIEERNSIWNTPYLFNAKEFDEETGPYYYGARYYDPRLSLWISTDAKQEENLNVSTYIYTFNNPIKYQDPDGNLPIETIWDATNLSLGINSFIGNIKKGSLGAALVDGVGIIADAAATALPYIPGGASSAIKAYRAGKTASKTTLKAGSKAPSKIMDATSKEFPSRRAAFRQAKRDAGIPTSKNFSTHVKGDAAKSGDSGRRGIEYTFDTEGAYGSQFNRYIQDHFEGHVYKDGSFDNTPHFNIHQKPGTPRLKNETKHYPYTTKKQRK